MGRRSLLTEEERRLLFGVPIDRDALARLYTLDHADLALVMTRRTPANRLGFAVVLALLRHPGLVPGLLWPPPAELVAYLAEQLGLDEAALDDYACRPQTAGDHALELAAALGMRMPRRTDVPLMIEAAAAAAWPTDRGLPIAQGVIAALHAAGVTLPAPATIERAGLAGQARARKRAIDALLQELSEDQIKSLDGLLAVDTQTSRTPLTGLKDLPAAPKADHLRELVDKLKTVRLTASIPTASDSSPAKDA